MTIKTDTYTIGTDKFRYIHCHKCDKKSYSYEDMKRRYCGKCGYHE